MAEAWVGEVRAFPYIRYAPEYWLECFGQTLQIQQYQLLYAVIGTTYGSDNSSTFKLPDLRSCVAIGYGQGQYMTHPLGAFTGSEQVLLNAENMPSHTHLVSAKSVGYNKFPQAYEAAPSAANFLGRYVSGTLGERVYSAAGSAPSSATFMNAATLANAGTQATPFTHENRQPFLAMRYCICFDGYFPQRP